MDEKIRVLNRYNVFVGVGILNKLPQLIDLKKYSSIFLIIDEGFYTSWSKKLAEIFPKICGKIIIPDGDQSKNMEMVQKVWQEMLSAGADRKTLVVNLGGGVIGDLGGFAASTYMRGVDFLQIPTTLLAQVDASVGGKVGINFLGIKNLIGTFQQPIAVIVDVSTLSSLPQRAYVSAFGEIIKHGAIFDREHFNFATSKKPQDFTEDELVEIIKKSCQIKADIVSKDEKEAGLRKLLNFGHTIGHAVEALSQQTPTPLLHGEAIAIGMITEGKISRELGLLSDEEYKILEKAIINTGLPQSFDVEKEAVLEKIKSDKKNEKGETNWTLLQSIGKSIYNQRVEDEIVKKAL